MATGILKRGGITLAVLAGLWAVYSGYRWLWMTTGWTWPFVADEYTMPPLHSIVSRLWEPAASDQPWLVRVLLEKAAFTAKEAFAGFALGAVVGFAIDYKQFGLDVTIKPGAPDITPEQVVASGQAEFGIDWLPSLLATRDKGGDLVNIAQVFTRSGMTELTHKDSGITSVAQMKGKKVGVWCCGNENELFAALVKNGLDPKSSSSVKIINQPFDMNLFLQRKVDAAAAMTYNELAQVLETKNPATGKLYTLADLNVITMEKAGTAMLEDGIFTTGSWLKDAKNVDVAKRFVAASLKGWAYCRDNVTACTAIVLKNGTLLGKGHQTWQTNEINKLIWPAAGGVGVMNTAAFNRTAKIAQQFKVIAKAPKGAYRTDVAKGAIALLKKQGVDVNGSAYKPAVVKVTAGGK